METELPEVRRADCGHGFLPIDTPPAARTQNGMHEQLVYLCDACRAQLQRPKVETKEVKPEAQPKRVEIKEVTPAGRQFLGERSLLQSMPDPKPAPPRKAEAPAELPAAKDDPYWEGRAARVGGVNQADNPYDGRSKQGRQWQRGWAEGAKK